MNSTTKKRSFTLVELSIVLLVLALLVGALLVGRKIVDRTKVQRIMSEFEAYEKMFQIFHTTYQVVPGNINSAVKNIFVQFADYPIVDEFSGNNVIGSYKYTGPSRYSMLCLQRANLTKIFDETNYNTERINFLVDDLQEYGADEDLGKKFSADFEKMYPKTSFDEETYLTFVGFRKEQPKTLGMLNGFSITKSELLDPKYMDTLNKHNAIVMFRANNFCDSEGGQCKKATGMISAKLANFLDVKMDDGQPGTGKILATKSGFATRPDTTQKEFEQTCYQGTNLEVSSAVYKQTNNVKYGCNLIKVMGDLNG